MSQPLASPSLEDRVVAHFWSGDAIRSRSVGQAVLHGRVDVPVPSARLLADWQRECGVQLALEPGDVEPLSLPRARTRWPEYRGSVRALADRMRSFDLADVLAASEVALMACRGARYHHDAERYGSAAFCNLFLSEDRGLDLHFPGVGLRIPLTRGTAVIFDTGQPHAVIDRQRAGFDAADFPSDRDRDQVFLSWELPIENPNVARALRIDFDIERATASRLDTEQLRLNGARIRTCPESGRWMPS